MTADALPVVNGEKLSRFLLDKSKIRSSNGTVKFTAFMPSKQHNNISVYRVTDLYEVDIWDIGHEFVSVPIGKPLLGRADIPARGVRGQGLEIEPAPNPHIRHANIINWPGTTEDRLIAIKLAEESQLVLAPGNGSLITISD